MEVRDRDTRDRSKSPERATLLPASDLLWHSNCFLLLFLDLLDLQVTGQQGLLAMRDACLWWAVHLTLSWSWLSDSQAQRLDLCCLWATLKHRTRPYVLARKGPMYPGKITSPFLKGQGGDCEEGKGECYPSYTGPPTTLSCLSAKEHMNTLCRTSSLG